jgi:hypothetical protein
MLILLEYVKFVTVNVQTVVVQDLNLTNVNLVRQILTLLTNLWTIVYLNAPKVIL